jgi:adenylate cyclase
MCVGGIPIANDEHAINAADLALEMMTSLATYNIRHGTTFKIRIGINSGPVMAGVIGLDKFTYDCMSISQQPIKTFFYYNKKR